MLGFKPRRSGTRACVLEPLYAQGLHRSWTQSQPSPELPLHFSHKASWSSMPMKGKPFGYWLCLAGSQSSFPKHHLCLAYQLLSKICKTGRDEVKIERFSKALFYCSEIPAVSGAQFNDGKMELPQGSPSKLSLAPSQGSQRGGFCRSCSLPWGLWCFFIPGKETPCPSAAQPENLHPSGQGQVVRHAALPLERKCLQDWWLDDLFRDYIKNYWLCY